MPVITISFNAMNFFAVALLAILQTEVALFCSRRDVATNSDKLENKTFYHLARDTIYSVQLSTHYTV